MALAPTLGHRRCRLRHHREHSGHREGGHPRLHGAGRPRKTHFLVWQRRLHLRRPKDLYTCPIGELLRRQSYDYRERSVRYAARPSACNACSLRARCTKSTKGRWIRRSFEEEYLERARGYRDSEPYRKAMRKRAVWVEPLFGEAKDWHGLRRFRLRRLEKVNTEALLKAAGQNIKRLLAFGTRGPKGSEQVAALRQPAPNLYEFRGVRRHRKRHSRRQEGFFNSLTPSRQSGE